MISSMVLSEGVSKEYAMEVALFLAVIAWMDEDLADEEVDYIYHMLEAYGEMTEFEVWKIRYQLAYPHQREELLTRLDYLVSKTDSVAEKKFALLALEEFIAVDGKVWDSEQEIYDKLFAKFYPR